MKLSVVTTLYFSEEYIEEFCDKVSKNIPEEFNKYEIILVDDGSPDKSLETALTVKLSNENIKIIELSRNFGHHKAIMAGLSNADGDYIFLIDIDLEEPLECVNELWSMIKLNKLDCCYGVQKSRKGKFGEKFFGNIFYKTLNAISDIKYPVNTLTARIMSREYVQALLYYKEKSLDIWGVFLLNGFKQSSIEIIKKSKGSTTYTFTKKISIAFEIITSLTSSPLVYIFYIGLIVFLLSLIFILTIILKAIFQDMSAVLGWASIIASIWFIGGLIILLLGILSIYVSKIFVEVKNRPLFTIKKIY